MRKKRGVFFTIDAILAAGILIAIIVLISRTYVSEPNTAQVSFISQDAIRVFTNMDVDGLDNELVEMMIDEGTITKKNNTFLEQIGEFWAEDEMELAARNLQFEKAAELRDMIEEVKTKTK